MKVGSTCTVGEVWARSARICSPTLCVKAGVTYRVGCSITFPPCGRYWDGSLNRCMVLTGLPDIPMYYYPPKVRRGK